MYYVGSMFNVVYYVCCKTATLLVPMLVSKLLQASNTDKKHN